MRLILEGTKRIVLLLLVSFYFFLVRITGKLFSYKRKRRVNPYCGPREVRFTGSKSYMWKGRTNHHLCGKQFFPKTVIIIISHISMTLTLLSSRGGIHLSSSWILQACDLRGEVIKGFTPSACFSQDTGFLSLNESRSAALRPACCEKAQTRPPGGTT